MDHVNDEPAAVFAAFNAAVNAHDVDGALGFFAAAAVAEFPNSPPPNMLAGTSEIRSWLEADSVQNIHVETDDVRTADNTVTATAQVATDELRTLGIMLVGTVEVTVAQGKIVAFRYLLAEESLAKWLSARS
jgi:hypothetical protein